MSRRSNYNFSNEYAVDFTQPNRILVYSKAADAPSSKPIFSGSGFINDANIARCLPGVLDPLLADLLDVALFVYLADRFSPRRSHKNPHYLFQWNRMFRLKIPVRRPELWNQEILKGSLKRLLRFFTEDNWDFDFEVRQQEPRPSERQSSLFSAELPQNLRVALFSGGLDSFAGVINQLAELPNHHFVLVSGITNPRQGKGQREQVNLIRQKMADRLSQVAIYFGLKHGGERVEETSQRSRGFLFLALGAVSALVAGIRELYVYENGIGAINLPYNGTQLGSANTRAINPISLLRMSQFISKLIGQDFQIHNPFLFLTKGQMCSYPEVQKLGKHIPLTFSCDSFPIRTKGKPQCGTCTSCLLRRLSLEAAGLSEFDDSSTYLHACEPHSVLGHQLRHLQAMEWQAQKIAGCLESPLPWQKLVCEFPGLLEISSEICVSQNVAAEQVRSNILKLYSQYASEWKAFSARNSLHSLALAA